MLEALRWLRLLGWLLMAIGLAWLVLTVNL
jgi:hypothetical protein